jgi:hypothetical protein
MNNTANNSQSLSFAVILLLAVCMFFALLARFNEGNFNLQHFPANNAIVEMKAELQAIPMPVAEVPPLSFTRNIPEGPIQLFILSLFGRESFVSYQQALLEQTQHYTFLLVKPVIAQALKQGFFFPHKSDDEPLSC